MQDKFMDDDDGGQDFTADFVLLQQSTTRVGKIVLMEQTQIQQTQMMMFN